MCSGGGRGSLQGGYLCSKDAQECNDVTGVVVAGEGHAL